MDATISRANERDAAEILDLQKLAYQTEAMLYQDWSIPPLLQTLDELRAEFVTMTFLKAVADGSIVGSVRAHLNASTCQIGRLIVHPDYRRRGIGTRLMCEIESAFPTAAVFELFTGHQSRDNMRLYLRLGYREVRRQWLSPRVTLVYLEKRR